MDTISGLRRTTVECSKVILNKIEDEYKTFQLPKLSHNEYQLVCEALNKLNETKERDDPGLLHLQSRLTNQIEESCGVSDLPKGHPAIEVQEGMTVRIYQIKSRVA